MYTLSHSSYSIDNSENVVGHRTNRKRHVNDSIGKLILYGSTYSCCRKRESAHAPYKHQEAKKLLLEAYRHFTRRTTEDSNSNGFLHVSRNSAFGFSRRQSSSSVNIPYRNPTNTHTRPKHPPHHLVRASRMRRIYSNSSTSQSSLIEKEHSTNTGQTPPKLLA